MKIEQILILHLNNTKQITLQGIGTFRLGPSFSLPENSDKKTMFPNEAITFEYDRKATQDALLIDAIVQHTKKIKPLATSDLDSFIMAGKELLALNNPFKLNGIGSVVKTQNGDLKFIPAHLTPAKNKNPKATKKNKTGLASYTNYRGIFSNRKKTLVFISAVVVLTAFILVTVFTGKKSDKDSPKPTQELSVGNSTGLEYADSVKTGKPITSNTTPDENKYVFKIVFFESTNYEAAQRKLNEITGFGHSPIIYKTGTLYKVAMPFRLPLTDTSRIIDSLDKFYSLGKGFIEVE